MKIQFIETVQHRSQIRAAGEVAEFRDQDAAALIASGHAKAVVSKPADEAIATQSAPAKPQTPKGI